MEGEIPRVMAEQVEDIVQLLKPLNYVDLIPDYVVLGGLIGYLIFILSFPSVMRKSFSIPLKYLQVLHFISLAGTYLFYSMCVGYFAYFHSSMEADFNPYRLFCDPKRHLREGGVPFLQFVFFLLCCYQVIDTIFLVLRKKPIPSHHWLYHMMMVTSSWLVLQSGASGLWLWIGVYSIGQVCINLYLTLFTLGWVSTSYIYSLVCLAVRCSSIIIPAFWVYIKYTHRCRGALLPIVLVTCIQALYSLVAVVFLPKGTPSEEKKKKVE